MNINFNDPKMRDMARRVLYAQRKVLLIGMPILYGLSIILAFTNSDNDSLQSDRWIYLLLLSFTFLVASLVFLGVIKRGYRIIFNEVWSIKDLLGNKSNL
jgi:hypothetical protein